MNPTITTILRALQAQGMDAAVTLSNHIAVLHDVEPQLQAIAAAAHTGITSIMPLDRATRLAHRSRIHACADGWKGLAEVTGCNLHHIHGSVHFVPRQYRRADEPGEQALPDLDPPQQAIGESPAMARDLDARMKTGHPDDAPNPLATNCWNCKHGGQFVDYDPMTGFDLIQCHRVKKADQSAPPASVSVDTAERCLDFEPRKS